MDHLCAVCDFSHKICNTKAGIVIAHRSGSRHNSKNVQGRRMNHHRKTLLLIFRIKEKIVHSLKGLSNLFADILPHKAY